MKKSNTISFFRVMIAISLIIALSGCGRNSEFIPDDNKNDVSSVVKEEITEWPDNVYTQAIIKPEIGEMDYVLYDEQAGYYALFLKNVSLEEGTQYIQLLQENGFETVANDSNSVTIGEVLQKDDTGLSVSVSENVLALYITLNGENQ